MTDRGLSVIRLKQLVVKPAVALGLLIGLVGLAHAPAARPLMGRLGRTLGLSSAACPLGYDQPRSPKQREAAALGFARAHRGTVPARERPSLGFVLGVTTREDVARWAKSQGVDCDSKARGPDLRCEQVPGAALPEGVHRSGGDELWLTFDSRSTLLSAVLVGRHPLAEEAAQTFREISDQLEKRAGSASHREGDGSAQALASALLYQSVAEYRFTDYYALARVTNLGDGFVVTEEYRALPN